jgi:hypothetical protein
MRLVPPLLAQAGMHMLSILPSRFDPLLPVNLDRRPKVFGIGFQKSGTTSLGRALRTLGFRVQKGFGFNRPGKRVVIPEPVTIEAVRDVALPMVPYYAAFEDNPWPLLFRDLDAAFPGSRFILTVRDPQRWIRSAVNYFGVKSNATLDLIYGRKGFCFAGNEAVALERFERHNAEVLDYFHARPNDLLAWDLTSNPGWDTLCRFLECPRPRRPFPHGKNSAARQRSPAPVP